MKLYCDGKIDEKSIWAFETITIPKKIIFTFSCVCNSYNEYEL